MRGNLKDGRGCPACSSKAATPLAKDVASCNNCGGIYGDLPDRSGVFDYVNLREMQADSASARYFDFTFGTSSGHYDRVHGWFDRTTKKVLQFG